MKLWRGWFYLVYLFSNMIPAVILVSLWRHKVCLIFPLVSGSVVRGE
jgi:hypothetical protein